ncbi:MAG: class I SAM-dependent methyltransferase, partial [Actinomycetia bacterium]|nr:class I SAM-dependent methyltransferase [Actinomycetes bacterium]
RYSQHKNTIEDEGYVAFLENFINIAIMGYSREVKTILDFGCGPVPVLAELLNRKGFVTDHYDKYFFPEYPEGKYYDMITATEVMEHIAEPIPVFIKLWESLSDGGYLAVMTEFYPVNRKELENWYYLRDKTHISFLCEETIKYIASVTGYQVIKMYRRRIAVLKKISLKF